MKGILKTSLKTATAALLFTLLCACAPGGKNGAPAESPVARAIAGGALVVDVRTPAEFSSGAYPGALNIPVSEVAQRLAEFGAKDRTVVVYCASGGRSSRARAMLLENGYQNVINAGGLRDMPPARDK